MKIYTTQNMQVEIAFLLNIERDIMFDARLLLSAIHSDQFPEEEENRKELAFIGRSNVGKSSLLNKILGRKHIARASRHPGCTKLINFFLVGDKWLFVDLPGYGYSQATKKTQRLWNPLMKHYFHRRCITYYMFLHDIRRTFQKEDMCFLKTLQPSKKLIVVLTKADKLSKSRQMKQKKAFDDQFSSSKPLYVFLVSTKNNQGIQEIQKIIYEQ